MANVKKRGLDSLLSQDSRASAERDQERYTRTVGFKVTDRQYKTYRRHSKYFGTEELITKWRSDIDRIEQEKGEDMEKVETEIRKRLTKKELTKTL
ncbi:MAG: hypothetical protein M1616_06330, partial [Candidatus Thermoplasmatota archaeon]|nr:hypothetical protein [Candidatus Thermoplasmatota archaeon]